MSSIEQEITRLEQELANKRQELQSQGIAPEAMPSEREIVREVVGERIQQAAPQYQPVSPQPPVDTPAARAQQENIPDELRASVQQLVNITFEKGIEEAVKEALKSDNAAIIDAFHDVIVDELYNELVNRQKIQQVK